MAATIHTTPLIESILGAEEMGRLRRGDIATFRCCRCDAAGRTGDEPVSVIIEVYRRMRRLTLAHARCGPPQIVTVDADLPPGLADPAAGVSVHVATAVLPVADGARPLLLVELVTDVIGRSETGDRVDLMVGQWLALGLTLTARAAQLPGRPDGWRLVLPGGDRVVVYGPGGEPMCDAECPQPPAWRHLVSSTRDCVLLTGPIGLAGMPPGTSVPELVRAINRTGKAGLLAGGVLPLSPR
jgi:hypothetical protein